jgi:hypothetical protein
LVSLLVNVTSADIRLSLFLITQFALVNLAALVALIHLFHCRFEQDEDTRDEFQGKMNG